MREPTRYVMFTVTVGLLGSGKSRTLRPFLRRYSVMPSTDVIRVIPGKRVGVPGWAPALAGVTAFFAGVAAFAGAGDAPGGAAGAVSRARVGEMPGATAGCVPVGCGASRPGASA